MDNDKLLIWAKGFLAKLMLGIKMQTPALLMVLDMMDIAENFLTFLEENEEGFSAETCADTDIFNWLVNYSLVFELDQNMPKEVRKMLAGHMRSFVVNDELLAQIDKFENGDNDLSLFENFLNTLEE
jgi:hypothetical protein